TLLLPVWLGRFYPAPPGEIAARTTPRDGRTEPEADRHEPVLAQVPLRVTDVALLLAIGLVLQIAAEATAAVIPGVPSVIWLTTYALAAGQVPAVRRLRGALHLGTLALNLFFVVIGIGSRVAEILEVGVEIFYFTATVVLLHGVLTYGASRLLRLDVETTSVASQAAVGGPSTAMALAVARERPQLALSGIMVGLLGYAIGTYSGLGIASLLRALLG
ncbi:MAG: DUF819 family protein, partial [Acidobacteriota bacterium]